jgi:hypothetical protein
MLGRIEWAWAAAPLVAIVGTVAIARMADLDIGFVRAETDIAVLEVYGEHPRGHLSRYAALYASLTTTYDIEFDDRNAVVTPYPSSLVDKDGSVLRVNLDRDSEVTLSGLRVASNSVGRVHSEQMLELGGSLRFVANSTGGGDVINDTTLSFHDVAIVRNQSFGHADSTTEQAWIGDLPAGRSATIQFEPTRDRQTVRLRDETASPAGGGRRELSIRGLWNLAVDTDDLAPGEARLVGMIDERIEGMNITPAASQRSSAGLVVAHLASPELSEPKPDLNGPKQQDYLTFNPDEETADGLNPDEVPPLQQQ